MGSSQDSNRGSVQYGIMLLATIFSIHCLYFLISYIYDLLHRKLGYSTGPAWLLVPIWPLYSLAFTGLVAYIVLRRKVVWYFRAPIYIGLLVSWMEMERVFIYMNLSTQRAEGLHAYSSVSNGNEELSVALSFCCVFAGIIVPELIAIVRNRQRISGESKES